MKKFIEYPLKITFSIINYFFSLIKSFYFIIRMFIDLFHFFTGLEIKKILLSLFIGVAVPAFVLHCLGSHSAIIKFVCYTAIIGTIAGCFLVIILALIFNKR